MEHVLLKATATVATDLGEFEAVISTEAVDREKDVVSADGMVAALHKWNRPIPLSWNHGLSPEDIFGHVDPQSARNAGGEVVINGQVDLDSKTGGEAWRSFKNRTIGFSFGYLIPDGGSTARKGGGRHITAVDIFEITATPAPMQNETRVLATKATTKQADAPPTTAQLRILNSMIGQAQEYIASNPDAEDAAEMADVLETLEELVGEPGTEDEGPGMTDDGKALDDERMLDDSKSVDVSGQDTTSVTSLDPLRAKADALALEFASDGESLRKAAPKPPAPPAEGMTLEDMRALEYGLTLATLSEGIP